jgi:hypothetical protein
LNPPSSGGLCEGVMTIPSARPSFLFPLYFRMAWDIAGVGVYPRPGWMHTATPLAARTSSAVRNAGLDSAWESMPRKSGPFIFCNLLKVQIA